MSQHKGLGISVRSRDIFISLIGIPLASGHTLPTGTAFVCRRGGATAALIFQHPGTGRLASVAMGKPRIQRELRRGGRHDLPLRLAAAFGFPLDHVPCPRPIANAHYRLAIPIPSLDGGELPAGTKVLYQAMSGLHVLTLPGRERHGFPARVVIGDSDLRALTPLNSSAGELMGTTREVA